MALNKKEKAKCMKVEDTKIMFSEKEESLTIDIAFIYFLS